MCVIAFVVIKVYKKLHTDGERMQVEESFIEKYK
jgi:hypothetical protein